MKVERICVLVSFLVTNEKLLKNLSDISEFKLKKKLNWLKVVQCGMLRADKIKKHRTQTEASPTSLYYYRGAPGGYL
jgi:hypothetical protein